MTLYLTNSFGGGKQAFVPQDPNDVRMYVCGPTVYNYAHIGNARPAVVFDVLVRRLRKEFPRVTYVRNLTDVDDKINAAALSEGVSISVITERYTGVYRDDMAALGVLPPDVEPKVTDHIQEIVWLIDALIASGHAYVAKQHVLFHVPSFKGYGQLSGRSLEEMIAGARVEVAPYKKHPADFVLWKPSSEEQPGWASPWGRGRPGWHIECSAMILRHLGKTIDIHGGGQDLIFPHHENEIAQGTRARYWIHNGFVTVEGRKMSKSLGNVLLVHNLLKQAPGEAIRYALLSAHYRQPLDWSVEGLRQARRSLDRLYGVLRDIGPSDTAPKQEDVSKHLGRFRAALDDDLNTPAALSELFRLSQAVRCKRDLEALPAQRQALVEAGGELGLLQQSPQAWFNLSREMGQPEDDPVNPLTVEALIDERRKARALRDFGGADKIRDQLAALGVVVEDRDGATTWRRASS